MTNLRHECLMLPYDARLQLAQELVDSVVAERSAPPLTEEQLKEIRRRDAALDSGEAQGIAWEQARKDLFSTR